MNDTYLSNLTDGTHGSFADDVGIIAIRSVPPAISEEPASARTRLPGASAPPSLLSPQNGWPR